MVKEGLESMREIHMVGIGGIGMSALAIILAEKGYRITGSDVEENSIIKKMREKGIAINIGHKASNIKDQDLVVYSSSIRSNNPELLEGKERKIPIISRTQLLKMVMDEKSRTVAVTGTHGKTTITAMCALLTQEAGLDPTVLIGGESPHFGGNAKLGKGDVLVAEVDESDGRFVILRAKHIIVPNLEREHVEHYKDEEELVSTFGEFLKAQSENSVFYYRIEDPNLRKLADEWRGEKTSFGFSEKADIYAADIKIEPFKIVFSCFYKREMLGTFTLNVPGIHNVLNALAAVSLGVRLGIDTDIIKGAIAKYKGVKRRFEVIGDVGGTKIVEDYAHHPTEIKATIQAAYSLKPRRLITVFQPHRYTRTKSFYKDFSTSFMGSSEVILTEVYSASEDRIDGSGVQSIYDEMVKQSSAPVTLLEKEKIPRHIRLNAKKGDIVLVLGAGDIGKVAREIFSELKRR